MAKWALVASLTLAFAGCGGPPVGSKVPKADPKKMAIGAAAAASAITLIDPKQANRKPEQAGEEQPKKVKKTGENVPGDVLDRLDDGSPDDDCESEEPAADEADADKNAAIPKVVNETRESAERERREKCSERAEPERDE